MFGFLIFSSYALYCMGVGSVFEIGAFNWFEKLFFLFSSLLFLLRGGQDRRVLGLMCFLFALVLFMAILTPYPYFNWFILLSAFNQLLIVFLFLSAVPRKEDVYLLHSAMALAPLFSVFIGFIYYLLGVRDLFSVEFATGLGRFQGSLIPAFLSGLSCVGAAASLKLYFGGSKMHIFIFIINVLFLLLSGGRMAMAVFVLVSFAILFFSNKIAFKTKVVYIYFFAFLAVLMVWLFFDMLYVRFAGSGDSGRELMWDYTIGLARKYSDTGIGFGHQFYSVSDDLVATFSSAAAHNDYLRIYLELGLVGSILFFFIFSVACFFSWRARGMSSIAIGASILCGAFMFMLTDNFLSSVAYFPLLFLGFNED